MLFITFLVILQFKMEQLYRLRHPNIIRVIGQCSCDGKLAFVMELMTDGSVDDS